MLLSQSQTLQIEKDMKVFSPSKTALFIFLLAAFSIPGCAPRQAVVTEPHPRPARVVVMPRPVRTVVVRPAPRFHPRPHRVVVIRRR